MNNITAQDQKELPQWLKYGSVILTIVGLGVLTVIEINNTYNQNWLSFLLVALLYVPIQVITESILSVYWESPKWIIKTIPIIFLASFYIAVLLLR